MLTFVAVGLAIGAILAVVIPPISRSRGLKRSAAAGAIWSGLANFEATEKGQAPVVADALSSIGPIYGSRFSRVGDSRPVGGLLFVTHERIFWQPRLWLGRGKANGWEIPAATIHDLVIEKDPLPAICSYHATLRTDSGNIRFNVVDPEGLDRAVQSLRT